MATLKQSLARLNKAGQLRVIDYPIDPRLEMAVIQRRALAAKAPALLFTRPRGSAFPMLANLYGSRERLKILFGKNLEKLKRLFELAAAGSISTRVAGFARLSPWLLSALPQYSRASASSLPLLRNQTSLASLPQLVSWSQDGGAFITLPVVQSEHPGTGKANWGMYRVQISGNVYGADEAGLHYQLQRGIGIHHTEALAKGRRLPVHVYVGGPPALAVAAVMPLPEGMDEMMIAGLLCGERMRLARTEGFALPILKEADFLLSGSIGAETAPEGPFGDHLGYYSLRHEFPVMKVDAVYHRDDAIWPFTTVGRPPQEDTVFGDLIHELCEPMSAKVFPGVSSINAVDAAGVHPLLLAVGSERYAPYAAERKSLELCRQGLHLLGATQTALAKYLLICAPAGYCHLDARDVANFLRYFLEATDLERDLHFITEAGSDTLDYSGGGLNQGSRLLWTAVGPGKRCLLTELDGDLALPPGFANPRLALPGVLVLESGPATLPRLERDALIENSLCPALGAWSNSSRCPLAVIVDDSSFASSALENFLWVTFTRSDPSFDTYGPGSHWRGKHWVCKQPLVIDARLKPFHPAVLEEDPDVVKKALDLARIGGPLHGLF